MANIYSTPKSVRTRKRLLILAPILMLVVGATTYIAVRDAHEKIVEFQAVNVAEIIARHAASGRSVYATQIAAKLARDGTGGPHMAFEENKGAVPLPAQFLKMVGRDASSTSQGLYQYRPLSKWNLEPTQGLSDDFQRWAWQQLEAQDQSNPNGPIGWRAVWRLENTNGQNSLRYMRADPASAQGCVDCHNALEKVPEIVDRRRAGGTEQGRTWKLHQLLGAIEVDIPLSKVEAVVAEQTRQTLIWIVSALGGGMIFVTWFAASDMSRTQQMLTLSRLALHDSLTGLYNSRGLLQRASKAINDPAARGKRHAMFYLRVNGFDEVIAACGNKAGDQLIKHVAEAMRKRLGAEPVVGRIHGVEFAGLLSESSTDNIKRTAEALLYSIKIVRFRWKEKVFNVGVNVGVAMVGAGVTDPEEVVKLAHQACSAAGSSGNNQIQIFGG